ncbi:MAG: 3-hydroxyacyl-CoA dehydrogenase family protein [Chitinophagaceae bacterium]
MTLAVLADEGLKQELLQKGVPEGVEVIWADSLQSLLIIEADVYMDLLFTMDLERISRLKRLTDKPVLVNAVVYTTKAIGADIIRINAWQGMLQRPVIEAAVPAGKEMAVQAVFDKLQWSYQVVPDVPGMITARVLAMIINEAFYTWGAQVSSREEIDIAMKLGTNYPMGPFEWSDKIGLPRVYELLHELSRTDERYKPAPALEEEVRKAK